MIVAIYAIYHLTIGIADVTNVLQSILKASSEQEIIDYPPHYFVAHCATRALETRKPGCYRVIEHLT